MIDLSVRRRLYAEEIQATSNLRTSAVVEALAAVPRERFLPPGPWTIRGEADFQQPPRTTPDADPRHVYHNLAIAIDPGRQLFNGAPGLLAMAIDVLALEAGQRVLHVGCGTGYYTAVMARCVGASGHVVAIDADEALAARAKANLVSMPWVAVRHGDASGPFDETFDAILINAGMTHPLPVWLDALEAGGRMVIPLTVLTAPPIGKGPMFLFTRTADPARLDARTVSFVAIYSAIGVRDDALNAKLGDALRTNPFPAVRHLRRDPHDPGASCWFHGFTSCLSLE